MTVVDSPPHQASRGAVLAATLRTPKARLLAILLPLLAIAAPFEGGAVVLPNLLTAVVSAVIVDEAFVLFDTHRFQVPTSAILTGLILGAILAPQEPPLVLAWSGAFAVFSKYLLRSNREHVFNPAALALLFATITFGSSESWWGALGDLPLPSALVLLVLGLVLVEPLNKLPLVLSFSGIYFACFSVVAFVAPGTVAEMFRQPFLQAALYLGFFMLTDPPTSPNRYVDQVWFGAVAALIACAAQLLGAGQTYLLLGVLGANVCLLVRRWWLRRSVPAPGTPTNFPTATSESRRSAQFTRTIASNGFGDSFVRGRHDALPLAPSELS